MPTFKFCEFCARYVEELDIHQLNCTRSTGIENRSDLTEQSSTERLQTHLESEFCSNVFLSNEELNAHQEKCKQEKIKCAKCNSLVERCMLAEHKEKQCIKHSSKCFYCDTEMLEEDLKLHISICDFSLVRCDKCQVKIQRFYMTHHLTVNCIKRMMQCEYCNSDVVADILEEHFEVCTFIPVYCENKCGQEVKRKELEQHLRKECPKRVVQCKYCAKDFEFEFLETHYSECEKFPVACPKVCGQLVPREEVEKHLDHACYKLYRKCAYQTVSCAFEGFPVDLRKHMQEDNIFHAEITSNKIGNLSRIVRNQTGIITRLEGKLKEMEVAFKETKEKVSELEGNLKVMSPGVILWRIADIHLVFRSKENHEFSTTFYDTKYGYKFQVYLFVIYSNVQGITDSTREFRMYIYLCSGENDSKLQWPFQKPITVRLVDRKRRGNDKTFSLFTASPCTSIQKPHKDGPNPYLYTSIMTGVKLEDYVCDNVMLIQIKVQ